MLDDDNRLLGKLSCKTRAHERSWQEVAVDMAALARQLLAQLGIAEQDCLKLGIGSPGLIDHLRGEVRYSNNLAWTDVPLVAEMQRHFALPVRLSNDANCAVLGEAVAGAAKGAEDVLLLTLGSGVGGGVIAGGVLQQGGGAGGMELGHTLLVCGGEECTCGRLGCLEAYASAWALIRHAREAAEKHPASAMHALCRNDLANMNGAIPFEAARMGDDAAQQVVDDYIRYLGEGIVNFVNIWRPERVLIGGGISNEGDPLILPLNEYVRTRCFGGQHGRVPHIERAALAGDAGLYGAAAL